MGGGNKRNNRNNRSIYTVGKYIEICLDKNKDTMRRTKSESSIYSYSADYSTKWNKHENSEDITISDIQIFPEKKLDELHEEYDDSKGQWIKKDITTREYEFGSLYQDLAEYIYNYEPIEV